MLKSLKDYVFVQIEGSLFNENTGIKGYNGTSIQLDTSYDPQVHVKVTGKVVAIPNKLGNAPISQETCGLPQRESGKRYRYKRRKDIKPEVKIGDRIYFHFNTLLSDNKNLLDEKKQIYKIAYENILCAVRDFKEDVSKENLSEIIMIGGYTMIEPDYETWEETRIPIPEIINGEVVVDKEGNPVMKPKDLWLIAKMKPEIRYLTGYMVNVGTPLNGDKNEMSIGDKIIYRRDADWPVTIEGEKYFIIRQRHILCHEVA